MPAYASAARDEKLHAIIRDEFDEMPGMRLTMPQVCRLWALTSAEAHAIIGTLVDRRLLTLDHVGRVCRPGDVMQ